MKNASAQMALGYTASGQAFRSQVCSQDGQRGSSRARGRHANPDAARVAGQYSGIAKRDRARRNHVFRAGFAMPSGAFDSADQRTSTVTIRSLAEVERDHILYVLRQVP